LINDHVGNRKYLTVAERRLFFRAVGDVAPELLTFCRVLAYIGARIPEVLALTPAHIDTTARLVALESCEKRRRNIFRAIPLPATLLGELTACITSRLRQSIWLSIETSLAVVRNYGVASHQRRYGRRPRDWSAGHAEGYAARLLGNRASGRDACYHGTLVAGSFPAEHNGNLR
jgi:hypothetical protein